jgi:hypothetical protein
VSCPIHKELILSVNVKVSMIRGIFILAFAFLTIGCGNVLNPNVVTASASSYKIAAITSGISDPTVIDNINNYNCPGASNIIPKLNFAADGSDYFNICPSTISGDYNDVVIQTKSSESVCIFAAQDYSGNPKWITNPNQAGPLYSCTTGTVAGAFITLGNGSPLTNFNGAYVVLEDDVIAMKQCLVSNYSYCPHYSYGKFR